MLVVCYVISRVLHTLPVLIGVTLFTLLAIQFVPGDPIRIMTRGHVSDTEVAAIYERLGMSRPLVVQYGSFLANAVTGDLGESIVQRAPVAKLVGEKIAPTLWLLTVGTVLSVLIALPLSLLAAAWPNSVFDHTVRAASMVGFAMPPFWIGLLLILGFGLKLGWLPISGYGEGFAGHLTLSGLTIACFLAPILIQTLRGSLLDALNADHIEVARAVCLNGASI